MQRPNSPSNQAIKINRVIFDFDLTISREHIHFFLTECLMNGTTSFIHHTQMYRHERWSGAEIDEMWGLMVKNNKHFTTGDALDWRNIFITLLDQNIEVAVASFSSFAPILKRFLSEVVQLPEAYLNKIRIESWLPDANRDDKNNHLDRIVLNVPVDEPITRKPLLSAADRKQHYQCFILVDDSPRNTNAVKQLTDEKNVIAVARSDNQTPQRIIQILNQRLGISIPLATPRDDFSPPTSRRP